ncbi:MAG: LolA family protein [Planctomycetota bacterium]|jgi:hypothetical protein
MKSADTINKLFNQSKITVGSNVDKKILDNAMSALPHQTRQPETNIWSLIMHRKITKPIAAAAIFTALLIGFEVLGINNASKAYAAAFDSIRQARTFSCREVFEIKREGVGKCILEQEWSFKEPDLERHVYIAGVDDRFIGEITITDYRKRRELTLNPVDKIATLSDKSEDYKIDPSTGKLRLTQLNTGIREKLLQMRNKAIKDLGTVELDGQSLRMLQSQKGDRITTVWIDSHSGLPVQIEIKWLEQNRHPVLYTSIQIDTPLDDNLFSFEPPEGYKLEQFTNGWPVYKKKICDKMMYLIRECWTDSGKHPKDLENIGITSEILRVILASPDQPSGSPVIQYRQPRPDREWSTEVIMYEIYDQWPNDGIVVGFADGHCELIRDQQFFEKLLE